MTTLSIAIAPERPDTAEAADLIAELEAHLAPQYPAASRHGLSVEQLIAEGVLFFVVRAAGQPAGCGGLKLYHSAGYGEVKRMYVRPAFRGLGCARRMLDHLSGEARARGLSQLRLETGIHQVDAIRLYERYGFARIPPFGPYRPDPLAVFFEKTLG